MAKRGGGNKRLVNYL